MGDRQAPYGELKAETSGGGVAARRSYKDTARSGRCDIAETTHRSIDNPKNHKTAATTRPSRDPKKRGNCYATPTTADLPVLIDGHVVNALVDTGADYSVLSGELAASLKKVMTTWDVPQVRTEGGT